MNNVDWQKIETIIDQVLELPEAKRAKFIEEKCGHNLQLKSEVMLLLESIFDSEGWLDNPHD
jgi:serine/threonine-protein kinase